LKGTKKGQLSLVTIANAVMAIGLLNLEKEKKLSHRPGEDISQRLR
jgi:hypothetical protein